MYPVSLDSVFTEILRNRIDRNRNASFPHTYILVCDPTVSDRKSIHSYVILRNIRVSSETPPLRKMSVYVRNIRSKNFTFTAVLRRYRMKLFMFFTKHGSTWQAKLLADLFPSLVGFVFISVYVDPHVPIPRFHAIVINKATIKYLPI